MSCDWSPHSVLTSDWSSWPDTYVTTALREGERRFLKKKSRVVSGSSDPFYNHRVKFLTSDLRRR